MNQTIHRGAVAPYKLVVTARSSYSDIDLSTASAAVLKVLRESSSEPEEWEATVSAPVVVEGGTQCTLTHEYEEGDVPKAGTLSVYAIVTCSAGQVQTHPFKLLVTQPFQ